MKKRLRLIWLALFSSMTEVETKTRDVMVANNHVYAESVKYHLEAIKHETWDLRGVRIEHSGNVDVSEIERFLGNAPYIIKNLLAIIQDGKIP